MYIYKAAAAVTVTFL